jgi:6-bladed beta-propeller
MPKKAAKKKKTKVPVPVPVEKQNPEKMGKGWFWLSGVVLVVLGLWIEIVSVEHRTPKYFPVRPIFSFSGDDQPCKGFRAYGLALVGDRWIAVSDQPDGRLLIFDKDGKFVRAITNKEAGPPKFAELSGVASDSKDDFYVVDTWNGLVRGFKLDGKPFFRLAVKNSYGPRGVALYHGDFFVADAGTHRILQFSADGTLLKAFGGGKRESFPGPWM